MPEEVPRPPRFPFSAVYGNGAAKTALLCAASNPAIKAVMVRGASGTAKTVLARAMPGVDPGREVVNVPLNVTEEMLFGTIDLEKAISTGRVEMGDSLLKRANGNYLYVDDADLFDNRLFTSLVDCVMEGRVLVERENISASYASDTTLIASMSSSRRTLGSRTMDCFDIVATMRRDPDDIAGGTEVARRNLDFADGLPASDAFAEEDAKLAGKVAKARELLPQVKISKARLKTIAQICKLLGVKGARGAISTARVAVTLAALDGRGRASDADVEYAALLCLDHRRTIRPRAEKKKPVALETGYNPLGGIKRFFHDDRGQNLEGSIRASINADAVEGSGGDLSALREDILAGDGMTEGVVVKVGEAFEAIDLLESEDSNGVLDGDDVAKRRFVESGDRKGKYIKARIPESGCPDVAFDATVRAAAPYQRSRHATGGYMAVILEKQDVREKVRQKNVSTTFFFVLDTSGSLLIRNRISKVKAAMKAMLETHYVKRDRVGLMTFNEKSIDVLLAPTRAVEQLESMVDGIEVGPGTPMSEALTKVYEYMRPYVTKHPDEKCHIVLVTDGKGTKPLEPGRDPIEESLEIARDVYIPNCDWIVIDTGLGFTKNDAPKEMAEALRGRFFLLDDIEKAEDAKGIWD